MEVVNNSTSYSVGQVNPQAAPHIDKAASFDIFAAAECLCHSFLQSPGSNETIALFLHPSGAGCPYCKTYILDSLHPKVVRSFYSLKRCVCRHCGKFFTATTGTLLQGCHNPRAVFLIAVFTALNADTSQLAKLLNMHPDSIRHWQKKLRAVEKE